MKLHPNIAQGILECLHSIFDEHHYTADVLDKAFRNHRQWGSRDRRFIAESTYEMVRWWRLLEEATQGILEKKSKYEKVFVAYLIKSGNEVPEWLLIDPSVVTHIFDRLQSGSPSRKIQESIPDWLDETGEKELGATLWAKELHSLNQSASVFFRVNTIKTNGNKLKALLEAKQIEVSSLPSSQEAFVLQKRQNLATLEEYQQGLFEIQDIGSQEIAPFLHVQKGMRVIDACAGAGGKTLHLAALLHNQGEIVSMDVEAKKLGNLQERAKRAGVKIVKTVLIDSQTISHYTGFCDRLLLDVPCSGSGVLKRNPDTKWKLSAEEMTKIKSTQHQILKAYPALLKEGGEMVYATCSIFPSENQEQVQEFLRQNAEHFTLLEEKHIWPSAGGDGYYMARLKKNE